MTALLKSFRPDVIQMEQAFPFLGLKPLLAELGLKPRLVLDAHNVESRMKTGIYEGSGISRTENLQLTERIAGLERELATKVDLTVAVSPEDQAIFRGLGASSSVLAPNGIYLSRSRSQDEDYWKKFFLAQRIRRKVLYVSSAHLPNWTGLQEMIGDGLGFLNPDERLLIAGGLSDYLTTRHVWPETPGAATFWCRATACGILTEERLGSLIALSDVIVLPIRAGGGSNLKTAEALLSGKPIVATSYAFRAYEQFSALPTVTVADTPAEFQRGIRYSLDNPAPSLSEKNMTALTAVTWPDCLNELVKRVAEL
jgi:glycosyltransferase involved in cell wall biosynthesis